MCSNQFKVGKLKASISLCEKEKVWIRVCVRWKDMAEKEEQRKEIQAFLQLLTTES